MENTLTSFVVIFAVAVLAPIIADLPPRLRVPTVVLEIALGVMVGPFVLGLADVTPWIDLFSQFGLAFLFFLAGFEIDIDRIKGKPLQLATLSWVTSFAIALVIASVLQALGVVQSFTYVGLAIATTAIGMLLPVLSDAGVLETPFGTHASAFGALGEFAPIIMMALLLETERNGLTSAIVLNIFILLTLAGVLAARRWHPPRLMRLMQQTMHSSGQLAVRIAILLVVGFVFLAERLGLDFLLGAFAAGMIVAQAVKFIPETARDEVETLLHKFEGIGFGLLIPVFFVVSGIKFDLGALLNSPTSLIMLPVFLVLFLVVRGLPAMLLYRHELGVRERQSLALLGATQLPLVIAITELGVEAERMTTPLATAMVGAAMVSVLIYPLLGLALYQRTSTR